MIKINVYAKSGKTPWLFDDFKVHFSRANVKGIEVITSNEPIKNADAWVAIRTQEATESPCLEKTVACINDLYEHDNMYLPNGLRGVVRDVKGLVLCHPSIKHILQKYGVSLKDKVILERAKGALSWFSPSNRIPEKFTIGWVGRNHWRKRIELFIESLKILDIPKDHYQVMFLGKELEASGQLLTSMGINCTVYPKSTFPITTYPDLYRKMNCLVITGITEGGPLAMFQSLATGNPVISTKVGWSPIIHKEAPYAVTLVENANEIAKAIKDHYNHRENNFKNRFAISKLMEGKTLESWFVDILLLTASLVKEKSLNN